MKLNEKMHAFIAERYYHYLMKKDTNGLNIFQYCTRCYGEQRGRRMAKRVLRDGKTLSFSNYCAYSEWMPTEEMIQSNQTNQSTIIRKEHDLIFRITRCPWHLQFQSSDAREAGIAYCNVIDPSIAHGFNPDIHYETTRTLHDHDCCIQIVSGSAGCDIPSKDVLRTRSFDYHCAHLFYSFRQSILDIYGTAATGIAEAVLSDFTRQYGQQAADILKSYETIDFESIN